MDKIMKNKRGIEPLTSCSSGYKTSSKNSLLVMYYMAKFDDVTQSSIWVTTNISSANLCKPVQNVLDYSTFICSSESGKRGKKGKNLQKIEYFKKEKIFLYEMKTIGHSFWRAII